MLLSPPVLSLKVEAIGKTFYYLYADGEPLSPARLLPGKPVAQEYELPRNSDGSWPRVQVKARIDRGGYLKIAWTDPLSRRSCDEKLWHSPEWQEADLPIAAPELRSAQRTSCSG